MKPLDSNEFAEALIGAILSGKEPMHPAFVRQSIESLRLRAGREALTKAAELLRAEADDYGPIYMNGSVEDALNRCADEIEVLRDKEVK